MRAFRKYNTEIELLLGAILLVLSVFYSISVAKDAYAQGFLVGGPILTIVPCNTGVWVTVGPPNPGSFIWTPATRTFALGPPTHPGQYLLGVAGPPAVCTLGPVPIGAGSLILFHGSSL